MRKTILALGISWNASLALATTGSAFEVETACTLQKFTTGDRYGLPCNFSLLPFVIHPASAVDSESVILRLPFQDRMRLTFRCESLQPVALNWAIGPHSGVASPSATSSALDQNLISSYESSTLQLAFKNPAGIQYFKPGCRIAVDTLYKSINTASLDVYLTQTIRYRNALEKIFKDVTPDSIWTRLLDSIDQAELILEFMQPGADEITAEQIASTLQELESTKTTLTQVCGGGSDAALCLQKTREARDTIYEEIGAANSDLRDMSYFLQQEMARLRLEPGALGTVENLGALLKKHGLGV